METKARSGGLSRDAIKYIGMVTMLLNHIAVIFLESGTWAAELLTAAGYFTAVTMIYFLAEGCRYTQNKRRYLARLFVFALLSELPYCLAFTQNGVLEFYGLDMLFTLCICFLLAQVWEAPIGAVQKGFLYFAGIAASALCDWGILGPVYMLLFLRAGTSRERVKTAFVQAVLLFGAFNLLGGLGRLAPAQNLLYAVLGMAGMGAAGVCIVYFYNGKRAAAGWTFSKWFFYLFYPGHLLVLGLLRIALR